MLERPRLASALAALGLLGGLSIAVLPQAASAQPRFTVKQEAAAHPRMVKAIRDLEAAKRELEAAPDDFGGNKARAIADVQTAIHSLKRALYYRLHMDDAALDAAH